METRQLNIRIPADLLAWLDEYGRDELTPEEAARQERAERAHGTASGGIRRALVVNLLNRSRERWRQRQQAATQHPEEDTN